MNQTELASLIRSRIERESGPLPMPTISYWLCGTPRTGSNLLRHTLMKAGCGRAAEGYHIYANREMKWGYDVKDFIRYNRQMIAAQTSPETGIFGLKVFWEQFQFYLSQCDQPAISNGETLTPYDKIAVFFPEIKFIFLRRRDKLRQAISLVKAKQSDNYIISPGKQTTPTKALPLRYNPRMISYYLHLFSAQDILWQHFFEQGGLSPHTIWYEDLETDFKLQVRSIYLYLGIETQRVGKPRFQKQSDQVNEEWYRRYLAENPWIEDPTDAVSLLANGHLRLLHHTDGESSVSPRIWLRRIIQLAADPVGYFKRLKIKIRS